MKNALKLSLTALLALSIVNCGGGGGDDNGNTGNDSSLGNTSSCMQHVVGWKGIPDFDDRGVKPYDGQFWASYEEIPLAEAIAYHDALLGNGLYASSQQLYYSTTTPPYVQSEHYEYNATYWLLLDTGYDEIYTYVDIYYDSPTYQLGRGHFRQDIMSSNKTILFSELDTIFPPTQSVFRQSGWGASYEANMTAQIEAYHDALTCPGALLDPNSGHDEVYCAVYERNEYKSWNCHVNKDGGSYIWNAYVNVDPVSGETHSSVSYLIPINVR